VSYEQPHTHEDIERLTAKLNERETQTHRGEVEDLICRMLDIIVNAANEATEVRVARICEWLGSVEAEEIIEGADVASLPVGETLAAAIERRFGDGP
jgi:hypothetical protein